MIYQLWILRSLSFQPLVRLNICSWFSLCERGSTLCELTSWNPLTSCIAKHCAALNSTTRHSYFGFSSSINSWGQIHCVIIDLDHIQNRSCLNVLTKRRFSWKSQVFKNKGPAANNTLHLSATPLRNSLAAIIIKTWLPKWIMSSHMLADHGKSKPSRTRPTQLSNLPKSTATIESAGPSPDFPGAFPKENPTLSAFRATTSSPVTANGRRSTLSNRERSESSTGSFYSALDHQSFSIPDEIGSNARTLSSFKSQAENESKRGRDGPEEEPLTMSKKQKIEDDERDGDSEQRQKTLDPQTLQKLLAAKESEVVRIKTIVRRIKKPNIHCTIGHAQEEGRRHQRAMFCRPKWQPDLAWYDWEAWSKSLNYCIKCIVQLPI